MRMMKLMRMWMLTTQASDGPLFKGLDEILKNLVFQSSFMTDKIFGFQMFMEGAATAKEKEEV